LTDGIDIRACRRRLGLAAAFTAVTLSQAFGQVSPVELRAEASFPAQYVESIARNARQNTTSGAPHFALAAIANLQSGLSSAIFASGGHEPLGSFREAGNTFASIGGNIVKRWGGLSTGVSLEHTHYYEDAFGRTASIGNEANVFVRQTFSPNRDWAIQPSLTANVRANEDLAVQRYGLSGRIDLERRLIGSWWLVASSRLRINTFVGSESGRRDVRTAIVGGLKYVFNDNVDARLLAGYEHRASNVADRGGDRFVVGVSLNLSLSTARPLR